MHQRGKPVHPVARRVSGAVRALDSRFGIAPFGTKVLNHIFPDNWSFLLGEVAMYAFVVLVLTGVFLTLYFVPSDTKVIYHGGYQPLVGAKVSEAYNSTMGISFDVRSGLLIRQMHHWAADIFIGSIVVHMCRVFFTSAYRKPRDVNWMVGITMLMLAIANGFLGYSLPDDLLSGNGVRIMDSIMLSVPFVGSYISSFFFQGVYPGTGVYMPRMFIIHVLVLPVIIAGLMGLHLLLIFRQEHTQFSGPNRSERNVVGTPLFPGFLAKTIGLLLLVAGTIAILGGVAQIDPIWSVGPYETYNVSQAAQPDWYMGWIDGALRLFPSWEATFLGHTIPLMVFIPAVLMPLGTFGLFYLWPAIERKVTRDRSRHHLLMRARDRPWHTAVGVGLFSFYFVLLLSSSTDLLAHTLHLPLQTVTVIFRVSVLLVPTAAALVAFRSCRELAARKTDDGQDEIVDRTPSGSFVVSREPTRADDQPLPPVPPPVLIGPPRSEQARPAHGRE